MHQLSNGLLEDHLLLCNFSNELFLSSLAQYLDLFCSGMQICSLVKMHFC